MNFEDLKLQWQALENWKKLLITVGFSLGIVYLIYVFKLEPIIIEKEKLNKEVQQLKFEVAHLKKRATPEKIIELEKKIEEVNKDIKTKKSELEILKKIIPDKAETDKILKSAATNVYTSNLILNKFNISKEETVYVSYNPDTKMLSIRTPTKKRGSQKIKKNKQEVQLKRITVNIQLTGSPKNLIKYISNLSKSKRPLIIDDVLLKIGKKGVKINMNISTFYSQEMKR